VEFASDNTAGVCPEVLDALLAESSRPGPAYGDDPTSKRLGSLVAEAFEHEVAVYPVSTGTAANSLALAATSPPWGGVLCHDEAHVVVDELAAPTVLSGGLTLHRLPGDHGRIDPAALTDVAVRADHGVHTVPFSALSLTQSTEAGTRYTADEIADLAGAAHAAGMVVHMDGARFANAVAATGASPAELSWRAGVDVLCLGATKGGALAAEAVVVFDPGRAPHLDRHRKRTGHLLSKQRLVSAQLLGWLQDDAWLRHADHANAMAARLAEVVTSRRLTLLHPVETNMVFLDLSPEQEAVLGSTGAAYYPRPLRSGRVEARLVTSWSTTVSDIDRFADALDGVGLGDRA
jgi:threonine aldolase